MIHKFELSVASTISLVISSALLIIRLGVVPVVVRPVSLETIWATSADAMVGLVLLLPTIGPPDCAVAIEHNTCVFSALSDYCNE